MLRSPKGSGVCPRLLLSAQPSLPFESTPFFPSAGKHVPGLLTLCCNRYCVGRWREACTKERLTSTLKWTSFRVFWLCALWKVWFARKQCSEGEGSSSFTEADVPRVWVTHLSVWQHQLGVTEKSQNPTTPRPVESTLLGVVQRPCPWEAQARSSVRTL